MLSAAALLCGLTFTVSAQSTVTISGKVQFTEPGFKVQLYQPDGFDKIVLSEAEVQPDNTYSMTVDVKQPGSAILDCAHWQSVRVWLQDEDLGVNFRGLDTAKIKIKNPPYVYINGGKNNELMNLINFDSYRNYQSMIAVSKAAYNANKECPEMTEQTYKNLTSSLYSYLGDNVDAYNRYYAEHYADRNSVIVAIERLNPETDAALIAQSLAKLEALSPEGKVLAENYRKAQAEKLERARRMAIGSPAPAFTAYTVKGKPVSPADFKGKVLVLDFWASWCGPCRAETPNLKAIYEENKGKDVEFLSVSIDQNDEAWLKAVKEDAAPWPQAHVKDAGKEVMDLYQFSGIPFILVIDKEGNIYRKSVRGNDIRTAVADALEGKSAEKPKATKGISMGAMMM